MWAAAVRAAAGAAEAVAEAEVAGAGFGAECDARFFRFIEMDLLKFTDGSAAVPVIHGCARICHIMGVSRRAKRRREASREHTWYVVMRFAGSTCSMRRIRSLACTEMSFQ